MKLYILDPADLRREALSIWPADHSWMKHKHLPPDARMHPYPECRGICRNISPSGISLVCTRPAGHLGPHAGHDSPGAAVIGLWGEMTETELKTIVVHLRLLGGSMNEQTPYATKNHH